MSRYIDGTWLLNFFVGMPDDYTLTIGNLRSVVNDAPSIDICFCRECKWEWTQKCPPHHKGLIHDESDYCSYGIRRTDDTVE